MQKFRILQTSSLLYLLLLLLATQTECMSANLTLKLLFKVSSLSQTNVDPHNGEDKAEGAVLGSFLL